MALVGSSGAYSYRQLMQLWTAAGGSKATAPIAAAIAMAESGGNPRAQNPSGAAGLWQINGLPFAGNVFDPNTNARMAVAKYRDAPGGGNNFGPWTTYRSGAYKKFVQGNAKAVATGGQAFVDEAQTFTGTPYVWGGESPKGFDCSGLVQYVAQKLGLKNVPRTSEAQWSYVHHITRAELKPGDLVFYAGSDGTPTNPGHVAIYAGGNQIIQAEETGTTVHKFPMSSAGTPVGYGRIPGVNGASFSGVTAHVGPGSSGGNAGDQVWNSIASSVLGGVNDVSSAAGNIISGGPLGAIAASVVELEQGIAWFFKPNHWVRIICGVLGVPLVGLGLFGMTRTGKPYSVNIPQVGEVPAAGGQLAPALSIAYVTIGSILLFVAFHNLEADGVHDWPSLAGYFQNALHTGGATSGGG